MPNCTINFPRESEINLKSFIYIYVMIPTFKIKFKHKFGAGIKKILKTFPFIKLYFMRVYFKNKQDLLKVEVYF